MYKLMRFYNRNRKKIFRIILIIVFIFVILKLLNYFTKIKANKKIEETVNNIDNALTTNNSTLISDKSSISGASIQSSKLKKDTDIINQFMDYCNNGDVSNAYNLLTDDCKKEMFPTIQDFSNIYYSSLFNGERKSYTIENWENDTYSVRITSDILSTGNLKGDETRQDYITIIENSKLNINSYVKKLNVNKKTSNKNITITVNYINVYMDYEIYDITIQNNTNDTILLDTNDDTKSVYLLDKNSMKYYFYNNELIKEKLSIQSNFKTNIQIKFDNSYKEKRNIESMIFTKMVLNYNEYKDEKDKDKYNYYTFKVNL